MAKTQYDVLVSAENAAHKAMTVKTDFELEDLKVAAFKADQNDPADWDMWLTFFSTRKGEYGSRLKAAAPSVAANAAKPPVVTAAPAS